MIEKIDSGRTTLHFDFKTRVEEALKFGGYPMALLDGGLSVGCDEVQGTDRGLAEIRRLTVNHFYHHNAKTPDVHLEAVQLPENTINKTLNIDYMRRRFRWVRSR